MREKSKIKYLSNAAGALFCVFLCGKLLKILQFLKKYYLINISHAKLSFDGGQMAELTCFYPAWFHFNQACGKGHTHTHTHSHSFIVPYS